MLPARGRNFTAAEDVPNGPPVCIVSHEAWQSLFGGRDALIGQTIQLNGAGWEVIGIMPPRMRVPFGQVQVFAPRVFETGGLTAAQIEAGATFAQPIARLKPGTTIDQARAELVAFSSAYQARHPANIDANNISEPRFFVATLVSGFQPTMYTLAGAVACVLLIACANVASLFLSRLLKRRKEVAVRLSLGATRGTVIRQLMTESVLYDDRRRGRGNAGRGSSAPRDGVGGRLAAAAQHGPHAELACAVVHRHGHAGVRDSHRPRSRLADVAYRCGRATEERRPGNRGRVRGTVPPGADRRRGDVVGGAADRCRAAARELHEAAGVDARLRAAGRRGRVCAAAGEPLCDRRAASRFLRADDRQRSGAGRRHRCGSGVLHSAHRGARTPYGVAGRPLPPLSQRPIVGLNVVSDGYFSLLQIPLAEGRAFNADDRSTSTAVCVVNETFARRVFSGQSAIGQALILGGANRRVEIVGVIRDVKSAGANAPTPDEAYFPLRQLGRAV